MKIFMCWDVGHAGERSSWPEKPSMRPGWRPHRKWSPTHGFTIVNTEMALFELTAAIKHLDPRRRLFGQIGRQAEQQHQRRGRQVLSEYQLSVVPVECDKPARRLARQTHDGRVIDARVVFCDGEDISSCLAQAVYAGHRDILVQQQPRGHALALLTATKCSSRKISVTKRTAASTSSRVSRG